MLITDFCLLFIPQTIKRRRKEEEDNEDKYENVKIIMLFRD